MKEDLDYDNLPEFIQEICDDVFNKYIDSVDDNEINKFLDENNYITRIEPFKSLGMITAIFRSTNYQNPNLATFCNELCYDNAYEDISASQDWFEEMVRAILSEDDHDDADYPIQELENIIRKMFDVVERRGGGGSGSGSEVGILDIFAAEIDLLWCQYAKTEDGNDPDLTTILSRMGCNLGNDIANDEYLGKTTLKRVISLLIANEKVSDNPEEGQSTIKDLFADYANGYLYGNYSNIDTSNYEEVIDSLTIYSINQFIFEICCWGMDFT